MPRSVVATNDPWMVLFPWDGGRFVCVRCAQSYTPNYPIPITMWLALVRSFEATHERCEPHPSGDACVYCLFRGHTFATCEWPGAAEAREVFAANGNPIR